MISTKEISVNKIYHLKMGVMNQLTEDENARLRSDEEVYSTSV